MRALHYTCEFHTFCKWKNCRIHLFLNQWKCCFSWITAFARFPECSILHTVKHKGSLVNPSDDIGIWAWFIANAMIRNPSPVWGHVFVELSHRIFRSSLSINFHVIICIGPVMTHAIDHYWSKVKTKHWLE